MYNLEYFLEKKTDGKIDIYWDRVEYSYLILLKMNSLAHKTDMVVYSYLPRTDIEYIRMVVTDQREFEIQFILTNGEIKHFSDQREFEIQFILTKGEIKLFSSDGINNYVSDRKFKQELIYIINANTPANIY